MNDRTSSLRRKINDREKAPLPELQPHHGVLRWAHERLCARRTGLSHRNWLALFAGSKTGALPLVERLANAATLDSFGPEGRTLLLNAAQYGHEAVVQLLLDLGASAALTDRRGVSPLMTAARSGHLGIVGMLLGKGAPLDQMNLEGYSALSWAVKYNQLSVAQHLLSAGADWTALTRDGRAPLDLAMLFEHEDMLALLVSADAIPFHGDASLDLCLWAIERNDALLLAKALARTENPNMELEFGLGLVSMAVAHGAAACLQTLIKFGVSASRADQLGLTPRRLAQSLGRKDCLALFDAEPALPAGRSYAG
ncbi:MAG: ankyrin repeat domain-containing protein [Humidesulfovibrio sp.]|nr:ankyrin repeat domain-containing protein [Humidesulfovibrio sp.]